MNTAALLATFLSTCNGQLQFGGSSSSASSGSSNTNTKQSQTDTRFFTGNEALDGGILGLGAGLLGGSSGCNCGRRRRQAPGEDQPGTRFFGLFGGGSNNNNCCNCGYNNNNNNIPSVRCECRYDLVFQDSRGNTHGACRTADETGKRWCYTTGN